MLPPFETYLTPTGDVAIRNLDSGTEFALGSADGMRLAEALLIEFKKRYPHTIEAIEQRYKVSEPLTWKAMRADSRVYTNKVVFVICACCFGELDSEPDWDGHDFHAEEPRGCRQRHFCPYCGYAERNRDSQLCICGPKRDYRLSAQELRIARLIQHGAVRPEQIADVIHTTVEGVRCSIKAICAKVGVQGMAELVFAIKDQRL